MCVYFLYGIWDLVVLCGIFIEKLEEMDKILKCMCIVFINDKEWLRILSVRG